MTKNDALIKLYGLKNRLKTEPDENVRKAIALRGLELNRQAFNIFIGNDLLISSRS